MSDQRVDQRSIAMTGARMNDEARRLVDDDDGVVLEEDVKCDRLRPWQGRFDIWDVDKDRFAGFDRISRLTYGRAARRYGSRKDQGLDTGPAQSLKMPRQCRIETAAGISIADGDRKRFRHE